MNLLCAALLLAACGNKKSDQGGTSGSAGSATATGSATSASNTAAAGSSAAAAGSADRAGSAAGNTVPAPLPSLPDGYSLVAKDETGGGMDELLRSSAQRQMAALRPGQWELRVSLKKADKTSSGLNCGVAIVVLTKPDMNMKATVNGSASVAGSDDGALAECVDAVIGNLVTTKLNTVVGAK